MSTSDAVRPYIIGAVTSKDGTTIGYRQMGSGPGLILVHGGMQSAENFMKLASALAGTFTVVVPDRRGRGLSGRYGEDYTIRKAVEDMQALLAETGTHNVFGLSAGAVVAIESALALPEIRRLAVYEPPLPVDDGFPLYWVPRYEQEMARGDSASAMITVMQGLGDTSVFSKLPRFVVLPLVRSMLNAQDKEAKQGIVTLKSLLPTMRYEVQMINTMEHTVEDYKDMQADVLLLGGSKSADYLKRALNRLEDILPHVRRIEFAGFDHIAADNGGHPERVAEELLRFFAAPDEQKS